MKRFDNVEYSSKTSDFQFSVDKWLLWVFVAIQTRSGLYKLYFNYKYFLRVFDCLLFNFHLVVSRLIYCLLINFYYVGL
jgi:hypothetical protein